MTLVNFSIGNNSIIDDEGGGVKKTNFEMTSFVNSPLPHMQIVGTSREVDEPTLGDSENSG